MLSAQDALDWLEQHLAIAKKASHTEGYVRGLDTAVSLVQDLINERSEPSVGADREVSRDAVLGVIAEGGALTLTEIMSRFRPEDAFYVRGFVLDLHAKGKLATEDGATFRRPNDRRQTL